MVRSSTVRLASVTLAPGDLGNHEASFPGLRESNKGP
jgi:hypothetical protein